MSDNRYFVASIIQEALTDVCRKATPLLGLGTTQIIYVTFKIKVDQRHKL